MKKIIFFVFGIVACLSLIAQTDQGISHQAVIRNNVGELVTNSTIGVKVSILQGSATGIDVYSETHFPISNAHGLITYIIGHGVVVEGMFEDIEWSDAPFFLRTEVDPAGGINYSIEGTTQFHSVPYAYHSKSADIAKTAESIKGSVASNITPPSATITEATDVDQLSATINGSVNGEGFLTNIVFEWGLNTSFGNTVEALQSPVKGADNINVSAALTGLKSATEYHYRIKASNAVDIVYSENMSFTTALSIAQVTTNNASSLATFSASSGGNIIYDGGSPITAKGVVWSTSENPTIEINLGISDDGNGMGEFTSELTGLSPQTAYFVRAYATNSLGTAYGNQISFTTLGDQPTASTLAASGITTTGAKLNGLVNPNYLNTTISFEYGLTIEFGNITGASVSPIMGSSLTNVSADLQNLNPGQTYYFRVRAENELGVVFGEVREFIVFENIISDNQGNNYGTFTIGSKEWMAENLKATSYADGTPITESQSSSDWSNATAGLYTIYPHSDIEGINNEDEMTNAYGIHYNWFAVIDEKGLCPVGWSMPSEDDWNELIDFLGGSNVAGGAMKSTNTEPDPHPRWNTPNVDANNVSGFGGLPAGIVNNNGDAIGLGEYAYFWSSNAYDLSNAFYKSLQNENSNVKSGTANIDETNLFLDNNNQYENSEIGSNYNSSSFNSGAPLKDYSESATTIKTFNYPVCGFIKTKENGCKGWDSRTNFLVKLNSAGGEGYWEINFNEIIVGAEVSNATYPTFNLPNGIGYSFSGEDDVWMPSQESSDGTFVIRDWIKFDGNYLYDIDANTGEVIVNAAIAAIPNPEVEVNRHGIFPFKWVGSIIPDKVSEKINDLDDSYNHIVYYKNSPLARNIIPINVDPSTGEYLGVDLEDMNKCQTCGNNSRKFYMLERPIKEQDHGVDAGDFHALYGEFYSTIPATHSVRWYTTDGGQAGAVVNKPIQGGTIVRTYALSMTDDKYYLLHSAPLLNFNKHHIIEIIWDDEPLGRIIYEEENTLTECVVVNAFEINKIDCDIENKKTGMSVRCVRNAD